MYKSDIKEIKLYCKSIIEKCDLLNFRTEEIVNCLYKFKLTGEIKYLNEIKDICIRIDSISNIINNKSKEIDIRCYYE